MDDDDDDLYGDASPPATKIHQVPVQDLLSRDTSTPKPTLATIPAQSQSALRNDVSMDDAANGAAEADADEDEDVEEVEIEVEEEDDDDVEFIFEPKAGQAAAPPPQGARYGIRGAGASVAPQRQTSTQDLKEHTTTASTSPAPRAAVPHVAKTPAVPRGPTPPPMATSTLDINAVPIHPFNGEKLTSLNIDDLPSKPWRNAGSDITDYFNYGFDEFTWTAYCQKQESTRKDFDPKKMMEDMMSMFGGMGDPSAMMGMAGGVNNAGNMAAAGPGGLPSGMPPIPPGMPPEMAAAMMQQLGMPGMPGMPSMPNMPNMPGMPSNFGMDMMGGNNQNRQDMSQQMFMHGNSGGQGGFGPQGMGQFPQAPGGSYAEEQQRFEQQKYMQQQQQRMQQQQQQRNFNNPNAAYGNFQNQNPANQMGRGRGGPGGPGGPGNVSQQRGW